MPSDGSKGATLAYSLVELRNTLRYSAVVILPGTLTSPLVLANSFPNLKIHSGRKM